MSEADGLSRLTANVRTLDLYVVTKAILISGALLCRFAISCRLSLLHFYTLRDMSSVFTALYCLYITHYSCQ